MHGVQCVQKENLLVEALMKKWLEIAVDV